MWICRRSGTLGRIGGGSSSIKMKIKGSDVAGGESLVAGPSSLQTSKTREELRRVEGGATGYGLQAKGDDGGTEVGGQRQEN